jgi:4-aminobutyrate aminotransferase
LATSGALATLDYILEHELQANALAVGKQLHRRLAQATASSKIVAEVRGKGLMLGLELVEPGTLTPAPRIANRVLQAAKDRGVLVGKGGLYGNVLRISPPMSVSAEVADQGASHLIDAVEAVERADH